MSTRFSFEATVRPGIALGVVGAVVLVAALLVVPAGVVRGTLVAALVLSGLSLGALVMLMIHDLTGGRWGTASRAPLAAMAAALPVGLMGLVPALVAHVTVFPWIDAPVALTGTMRQKLPYLAPPFLAARTVISALVWLVLVRFVALRPPGGVARQRLAVGGLILVALTLLTFSTDWMVALDPRFYSTIYAMLEASGEATGAFAAAVLILFFTGVLDRREESVPRVLVAEDLANLLFGLVLMTAYLAFMQWLIVWAGNLPEEIGWYIDRGRGAWRGLLFVMVALHFVIPTAGFLSRRLKRAPAGLAPLAAAVLGGHVLDVVWRTAPSWHDGGVATAGLTIVAMVGGGGLWLAAAGLAFRRGFATRPEVAHA